MSLEKFFQSCMMPKDSDMFKGGTEKDGTLNLEYCNYCYDNGVFMKSDSICTANDMQEFVKGALKEQGIGKELKDSSILLVF